MDFFCDNRTTSTSTPPSHADSQADPGEGLDTTPDTSREQISCMNAIKTGEQNISSKIDDISGRVQDIVGKINTSRANDQKVMESFQKKLVEKVTGMCQEMKECMYTAYEDNSNDMQAKLQELSELLDSCTKLNDELRGASQALASLRNGLSQSFSPEQ